MTVLRSSNGTPLDPRSGPCFRFLSSAHVSLDRIGPEVGVSRGCSVTNAGTFPHRAFAWPARYANGVERIVEMVILKVRAEPPHGALAAQTLFD
jgi:hypothetical protein